MWLSGPPLPKVLPLQLPPLPPSHSDKVNSLCPASHPLSAPPGQSVFTSSRQRREGEGRRALPSPPSPFVQNKLEINSNMKGDTPPVHKCIQNTDRNHARKTGYRLPMYFFFVQYDSFLIVEETWRGKLLSYIYLSPLLLQLRLSEGGGGLNWWSQPPRQDLHWKYYIQLLTFSMSAFLLCGPVLSASFWPHSFLIYHPFLSSFCYFAPHMSSSPSAA